MKLVFLTVFVIAVVGCSAQSQSPPEIDGNWQLASGEVGGQPFPLLEGRPISLQITGTEASGNSSCNQYGGQVIVDGTAIEFGELVTTMMACEADLMEVESAYTDALRRVDTGTRDGADLILTGPEVELRFNSAG